MSDSSCACIAFKSSQTKVRPKGHVSDRNEKNLKKKDFAVKVVSFTLIIYVAFLAL